VYISLGHGWVLRGYLKSNLYILFNYKKGIRIKLPENVFKFITFHMSLSYREIPSSIHDYIKTLMEYNIVYETNEKVLDVKHRVHIYDGHFLDTVLWHITEYCNASCPHCYVNPVHYSSEHELEASKISYFLNQMSDVGVLAVNISGGEPGLVKNLHEVISAIDDHFIHVEGIFTNGTLYKNLNVLDKLHQRGQYTVIYVSLDGPKEEIHGHFRGNKELFEYALKLVNEVRKYDNLRISINTIIHRELINVAEEMFEFVYELKPYSWRIEPPFPTCKWDTYIRKYGVNINEICNFYQQILRKWLEYGEPFTLELGHVFRSQVTSTKELTYQPNTPVCSCFRDMIAIFPNGDVLHCPTLIRDKNTVLGNIFIQSLRSIWESHIMRLLKELTVDDLIRLRPLVFDRCRKCKFLSICGCGCRGHAYNLNGDYFGFDDILCQEISQCLPRIRELLRGTRYEGEI